MIFLAQRSHVPERMDAPNLDPVIYAAVLRDLARVNAWAFSARPTISFLRRAAKDMPSFRLLDVGFGHGDMLRRIAHWAEGRGIAADLTGVDLNPNSAPAARAATPPELGIEYHTGDYRDAPGPFDFIVSSLVAHHMTEDELIVFIRHMETHARRGWLINDLHRHGLARAGFPVLARTMGVHPIVREDGALSIARAFRPAEWKAILRQAGIARGDARIVRYFPFRLCVERLR